jgi:putative oxidoreductase
MGLAKAGGVVGGVRRLVPGLLRVGVGAFFLFAVVMKLTNVTTTQNGLESGVAAFASAIERGGVIPGSMAWGTALVVLGIEIALGVGLLSHRMVKKWASGAVVFLFVMTAYLLFLQIRGKTPECGCLGQWDSSIPLSIVRNAVLSLACLPSLIAFGGSAADDGLEMAT